MKPQPLKLVIEHYRRLRDDSVAAQARVQMELTTAQRTLRTLDEYRQEQLQRARDSRRDAISTSQLLLQTRFTGKLDEAIALQKQRIAEIEHRIDACRAQVLGHQQRLKAIETIEDQRAARAQRPGRPRRPGRHRRTRCQRARARYPAGPGRQGLAPPFHAIQMTSPVQTSSASPTQTARPNASQRDPVSSGSNAAGGPADGKGGGALFSDLVSRAGAEREALQGAQNGAEQRAAQEARTRGEPMKRREK